jgi:hypothetical protein
MMMIFFFSLDVRTALEETDYGSFLQDEQSPLRVQVNFLDLTKPPFIFLVDDCY